MTIKKKKKNLRDGETDFFPKEVGDKLWTQVKLERSSPTWLTWLTFHSSSLPSNINDISKKYVTKGIFKSEICPPGLANVSKKFFYITWNIGCLRTTYKLKKGQVKAKGAANGFQWMSLLVFSWVPVLKARKNSSLKVIFEVLEAIGRNREQASSV